EVMAPGVPAAEIELATVRLAEELGFADNLRHHAGHSIGLEGHEAPFLDRGDDAVLEPGMVFTVEPGVYIKELGGFRHSDTVVITPDGRRVMTDYPRELKDLIVLPTAAVPLWRTRLLTRCSTGTPACTRWRTRSSETGGSASCSPCATTVSCGLRSVHTLPIASRGRLPGTYT